MEEDDEAAEVTEAKPDGPSITFPEYLRTYLDSIFEKPTGALVASTSQDRDLNLNAFRERHTDYV